MPQQSERMSGADATWLHMDREHNPMVVNTLLIFDDRPDWAGVESAVAERLVKLFRRFRQRPVEPLVTLGAIGPRWEPDRSLDLARHVVRVDLGDDDGAGRALDDYIGEQASRPLGRDRPLWEVHCIDGPGRSAALLLRTHHAMADGNALVQVIADLTDPADPGASRPPAASPSPSAGSAVDRGGIPVAGPLLRGSATLAKLGSRVDVLPGRGREPLCGTKSIARSAPVPLPVLKAAGAATGATINDVLLAVAAGALRRYRVERGDEADDVDVIVPFDVRGPSTDAKGELGNRFGLVFVTLPVSVDEAADRLAKVTAQMRGIKGSTEPHVVFGALTTMGHVPPVAERVWVDAFVADAEAVVTNIVGPRRAVTLAGTPVTAMVLWVPSTGPIGLGVSLFSYDGAATVGLIADDAVIPDMGELAAALDRELAEVSRG